MRKTIIAFMSAGLLISTQVQADFIGFQVGTSSWTPDYSGQFGLDGASTTGTDIDIEDDLGFSDESHSVIWVKIEHPVPILPNFKVVSSDLDASASSTLTSAINYGDETFSASANISTQFDLSNTELTMYYELLDNWVNLDVGLTARQYDGRARIAEDGGNSASEDIDFVLPLLYAAVRFDLPFTGFFIDSELNTISVSDNEVTDTFVAIGYESDFGLGGRLGYRSLDLKFDESDLDVDLEFSGTYLNVFYHF